jgi:hypothetical protein
VIYEYPDREDPIEQGDIFVGLPRPDVPLDEVAFLAPSGPMQASWEELALRGLPVKATVQLTPVSAIVISQNCDALRGPHVSLCEIQDFRSVEKKALQMPDTPKKWQGMLTQQARLNQKWFYLPPNSDLGWDEKMAADFRMTLRLPHDGLLKLRGFRRARLIRMASDHFRERIADFFRRYSYDEWYPLTPEEFEAYQKDSHGDAEPFHWQKKTDAS